MKDKKENGSFQTSFPPNFPNFSFQISLCPKIPFLLILLIPTVRLSYRSYSPRLAFFSPRLPRSRCFTVETSKHHFVHVVPDCFLHIIDCHDPRQDTNCSTQPITIETLTIGSARVKHRVFGVKCAPNNS